MDTLLFYIKQISFYARAFPNMNVCKQRPADFASRTTYSLRNDLCWNTRENTICHGEERFVRRKNILSFVFTLNKIVNSEHD